MDRVIHPGKLGGRIAAIPSKSDAHRLLFCAALAYTPTEIVVGKGELSADIHATINCIRALGGDVTVNEDCLLVTPIPMPMKHVPIVCDCGESGEPLVIILNDNEMSIDRNVGGLARHLSRLRTKEKYLASPYATYGTMALSGLAGAVLLGGAGIVAAKRRENER